MVAAGCLQNIIIDAILNSSQTTKESFMALPLNSYREVRVLVANCRQNGVCKHRLQSLFSLNNAGGDDHVRVRLVSRLVQWEARR